MGFEDREQKRAGRGVIATMLAVPKNAIKTVPGKGRPKTDRETKKRVSLAILPSLYNDIQKIAFVERKSASEIISYCLKQHVKRNSDKLSEYEQIKRGAEEGHNRRDSMLPFSADTVDTTFP